MASVALVQATLRPRQAAIAATLLVGCISGPPPFGVTDTAGCEGTAHWLDRGVCFEAPRCCASSECPSGWACNVEGRCVDQARTCGCRTDTDCGSPPRPTVCVINAAVCGACVVVPDACPGGDGDCASSAACVDGSCLDRASRCFPTP